MLHFFPAPEAVLNALLTASWQGGVLVLLVLLIQKVAGPWLTAHGRYALWSVVVLRLLLPVAPASPVSLWGLFEPTKTATVVQPAAPPVATSQHIRDVQPVLPSAAPSIETRPAASRFSLPAALLTAWLLGVALVTGRALIAHRRLARRIQRDTTPAPPHLQPLLDQRRVAHQVRRAVTAQVSAAVTTPTLLGLRRPRVVLPPAVADRFSKQELTHVFDHELAHLKRHDLFANWLLVAAVALHWFNPLVWFAARRLRHDREPARDAAVLTHAPDPIAYGRTLLRVLELIPHATPRPIPSTAVAMSLAPRDAHQRFARIARHQPPRRVKQFAGLALLAGLVLLGCTTGTAPAAAPAATSEPAAEPQDPDAVTRSSLGYDAGFGPHSEAFNKPTTAKWDAATLAEVVEDIRTQTGAPLWINWPALNAAGYDPATPIKFWINTPLPAHRMLNLAAQQVNSLGTKPVIDFFTADGVVTITSADDAWRSQPRDLRVLELQDLFGSSGKPTDNPSFDVPDEAMESVILKLIRETVGQPRDWSGEGTPEQPLRFQNGNLIVHATPSHHRQINGLLRKLRESRNPPAYLIDSELYFLDATKARPFRELMERARNPDQSRTAGGTLMAVIPNASFEPIRTERLDPEEQIQYLNPSVQVNANEPASVLMEREIPYVQQAQRNERGGFDLALDAIRESYRLTATVQPGAAPGRPPSVDLALQLIVVNDPFDTRQVFGSAADPEDSASVEILSATHWRPAASFPLPADHAALVLGPALDRLPELGGRTGPLNAEDVPRHPLVVVRVRPGGPQ